MRTLYLKLLVCTTGLLVLGGCQLLQHESGAEYQTVEASPQRDTEEAEKQHKKAAKIILRYLNGDRHHVDLGKAEEHLQKALVADVTHAPSHNSLGVLYLWRRDLYLAAWEFEYANKLVPWTYEPLHNLGMVYDEADRPDRAVCYYEMAYEIAPGNPEVIGNLARARLRRGDSLDGVRPLLQELKMADHREDWLDWASEQLGLNPVSVVSATTSNDAPALLLDDDVQGDAELPDSTVIPPPAPPDSLGSYPLMLEPEGDPAFESGEQQEF